jgi:protein deglycase
MGVETESLVILAPGFEEIEAVTIADVLRRAQIPTALVALSGSGAVLGAHGIAIQTDRPLREAEAEQCAMTILPGGMPGSRHLAENALLRRVLQARVAQNRWVAALCAAPLALQSAGLLKDRRMTCYPSLTEYFPASRYESAAVVRDDPIITGSGPGAALRFALELARALGKTTEADQLHADMLVEAFA